MTDTKTFRPIKRNWLGSLSRSQVIPVDQLPKRTPKAIKDADAAAVDAMDQLDQASRDLVHARAELADAPRFDREHERAEIEADRPTPEPTAPAKAAELDRAERRRAAAESLAKERVAELYEAVHVDYPDYLAAIEAAQQEHRDRVDQLLSELVDTIARQRELNEIAAPAREWERNVHVPLCRPSGRVSVRDRLAQDLEKARVARVDLEGTRAQAVVHARTPNLIAALEDLLAKEMGP